MARVTCYECGREAEPEDGRCAFCDHRMCFQHTIRTTLYGEWVSWCQPCRSRYDADQEPHRDGYPQEVRQS